MTNTKQKKPNSTKVKEVTSTVGRVSSVVMEDKSPEYMYDDGSIIGFEDGFRMMVGQEKQPSTMPTMSGMGKSRIGNGEHSESCGCLVCKRKK